MQFQTLGKEQNTSQSYRQIIAFAQYFNRFENTYKTSEERSSLLREFQGLAAFKKKQDFLHNSTLELVKQ